LQAANQDGKIEIVGQPVIRLTELAADRRFNILDQKPTVVELQNVGNRLTQLMMFVVQSA
jgi:hypothetical protein